VTTLAQAQLQTHLAASAGFADTS